MSQDYSGMIAGLVTVIILSLATLSWVSLVNNIRDSNTPHYQLNHCYENTPSEFNEPLQIKIVNIGKTKYQYYYLDSLNLCKKLKLSPRIPNNLRFSELESLFTKEIPCE